MNFKYLGVLDYAYTKYMPTLTCEKVALVLATLYVLSFTCQIRHTTTNEHYKYGWFDVYGKRRDQFVIQRTMTTTPLTYQPQRKTEGEGKTTPSFVLLKNS